MKPRIAKNGSVGMFPWSVETENRRVVFRSWNAAVRWALWYCDVNGGIV